MTLRWLGILLPLAMTYGLGLWMAFSRGSHSGFLVALGLAALFWICCAAALLCRRDRGGAAAITVVYLFADAWWILVASGAAPAD